MSDALSYQDSKVHRPSNQWNQDLQTMERWKSNHWINNHKEPFSHHTKDWTVEGSPTKIRVLAATCYLALLWKF